MSNKSVVSVDPQKFHGKPYFTGTNILVEEVLRCSKSQIRKNYPVLSEEQINFVENNLLVE